MTKTDFDPARSHQRVFARCILLMVTVATALCLFVSVAQAQDSQPVGQPLSEPVADPSGVAGSDEIWLPLVSTVIQPRSPWPTHGMDSVSPNTWLTWEFDTPDPAAVRYSVLLDDSPLMADALVGSDVQGEFLELPTLKSGWRYDWQVVAELPDGSMVAGPVWSFHTESAEAPPAIGAMIAIPAGELTMGCDAAHDGGYGCRPREVPQHKVWVDAFEIDKYEVTNGQYQDCVNAGGCNPPRFSFSISRPWYYGNPDYAEYPVLYVSWWNSRDYCRWSDKRLPTEAEWEMAARGPYDLRPWPWGEETIDCTRANFTDTRDERNWIVCAGYDTTRVGSYPAGATALGVMDMSGNAFEWVNDVWDPFYYNYSPYMNPQGPGSSTNPAAMPEFVIRGGSYRPNWFYPRTFNRHWGHHGFEGVGADSPYYRNDQVGFRCAR